MEHFALGGVEGEEFEAVAQAVAITDDSANFQWVGTERQRNLERNNFTGLKLAGESGADAILAEFGSTSPTTLKFSGLEHAALPAGVDGKARVTTTIGAGGFLGREFFGGCRHNVS